MTAAREVATTVRTHPEPTPEMLDAAVRGDRAAQGAVAELYYPRMRRWALLETADPALAEDAVQEALLRWIRYASTYRADQPFGPWMRSLVRNSARDVRSRKRRRVLALPWSPPVPNPDRAIDLSRAARRALALLGQLTSRQRELVDLCDVQGLSAVDAADHLDVSPNTVRVHLHEGRKRLQQLLDASDRDVMEEG